MVSGAQASRWGHPAGPLVRSRQFRQLQPLPLASDCQAQLRHEVRVHEVEPSLSASRHGLDHPLDSLLQQRPAAEPHAQPLELKSDNGGPFRAEEVKQLLAEHDVVPLFNPVRHPQYNGGVERANGQLASYQESLAEFHGRPGLPTREDAAGAQRLANELARPAGWCGPTAGELWQQRPVITTNQRAVFLATVAEHRAQVRAQWGFAPDEPLSHYEAAAVDRRAARDALVEHDLLRIHPRRRRRRADETETAHVSAQRASGEGTITLAAFGASPMVGERTEHESHLATPLRIQSEEAHYSTDKLSASGKNWRLGTIVDRDPSRCCARTANRNLSHTRK